MCRGIFGCPTRAAGYATIVIPSSLFLTVGIIVEFVAEFFVLSVRRAQFLPNLMTQGLVVKTGRGSGSVIIALSNGNKRYFLLIMGPVWLALGSVHHHLQQAWSAPSPAVPVTVAAVLLVQLHAQLGLTRVCHIALLLVLNNLLKWIQLQSNKTIQHVEGARMPLWLHSIHLRTRSGIA